MTNLTLKCVRYVRVFVNNRVRCNQVLLYYQNMVLFPGVIEYQGNSSFLKYEGQIIDGEPSGNGTMIYVNGEKYEGEWLAGKRNGIGNLSYAKDDELERVMYVGEWRYDKRSGYGALTMKYNPEVVNRILFEKQTVGDRYEGEWNDDKQSGNGTFTWQVSIFTNILRVAFSYESFARSFFVLTFRFILFVAIILAKKLRKK